MNRHRVLLILNTELGQYGGTERNATHFANALIASGIEPVVVAAGQNVFERDEFRGSLHVERLPVARFGDASLGDWRRLIRSLTPQGIVRVKNSPTTQNLALDWAARLAVKHYVGWEHHPGGVIMETPSSGGLGLGLWKLPGYVHARAVERTVVVSDAVRDPLVRHYGFDPARVDIVYPGIDFAHFSPNPAGRASVRAQWDVPADAIVVGSVGRMVETKRNDFSVQVFADLRRRMPDAPLWCVLAGSGPDIARLAALADELGVSDRVRLPGWQESAAAAWNAVDIALLPSSEEGLGMALIEAIGCGAIALGADIGGIPEVLYGELGQWVLPAHSVDAWVESIAGLTTASSSERAKLHGLALAGVRKRFEATRQWPALVEWYRRIARLD